MHPRVPLRRDADAVEASALAPPVAPRRIEDSPRRSRIRRLTPRELAYCGLFGAAALLLPVLFHVLHLGHVFMPMYLPLVTLAFLVAPLPAAVTALVTPLLSAAVTGMPPLYPPVALFMALELAAMAAIIAAVRSRWPRVHALVVLVPTLLLGRAVYVALVYLFSLVIDLPAAFMAGLSLLSGWPGILLMIAVVPALVRPGSNRHPMPVGAVGSSRGRS